ncbi:MAG: DUF2892 domain-containing protein [Gammaproteobacteria bacterium]
MEKNVGGADKTIRIIVGLVIIALGVFYQSWWGALGLLPLATALLGWCPPYALLGINTCKTRKTHG